MTVQWSDDFEPNTLNKSNRGSVWIKTLTMITDSSNKNDFVNTYSISIGSKSAQNDIIEIEYLKECQELSHGINNIFHCMEKKINMHISFPCNKHIIDTM